MVDAYFRYGLRGTVFKKGYMELLHALASKLQGLYHKPDATRLELAECETRVRRYSSKYCW